MIAATRLRRFDYAWIVAGVTFLTLLTSAGIGATRNVLILPLGDDFGWDRATISLAVAVNLFLYGMCGPFAGAFMLRFGIRRVMVGALLTLAAGVGVSMFVQQPWQLILLWGVVVGLGSGAMALVLGATVANRWFVKRRGLVLGLLTASNATGQLVFLPIQAAIVVDFGWRMAVLTAALVALVVSGVVFWFMRDDPRDVGSRPYGAPADWSPPTPSAVGNPFGAALTTLGELSRTRDFWFLAGSFFICGASTAGLIGTHLIPASADHGVPEVTAASLLAVIGAFDLVGTTCSGWLSDRIDNRLLLVWYYSLRGLSLLFLPFAYSSGIFGLAAFAVFYGLDWVATVPPTVRLASDRFGPQRVGVVFGWIFASHQVGAAAAAFGAGAVRTWAGDYQLSFMAAGLLCLVAAGLVTRIGRSPSGRPLPATTPVFVGSR
ncbi:MAG: MFS transporter [Chloroflexi bacterium]|nr:MFS transporter [Chloroflexota bacterium]